MPRSLLLKLLFTFLLVFSGHALVFSTYSIQLAYKSGATFPADNYVRTLQFTNPVIYTGITVIYTKLALFNASLTTSYESTLTSNMIKVNLGNTTGWNAAVSLVTISLLVMESNPDAYYALVVNQTSADQNFTIPNRWDVNNTIIRNSLIGWQIINSSVNFNCSVVAAGVLNCKFPNYDATKASFIMYNVLLIDSNWKNTSCPNCLASGFSESQNFDYVHKANPLDEYAYFCAINYFGADRQYLGCVDAGDSFGLGLGSGSTYKVGFHVTSFPMPLNKPAVTYTEKPVKVPYNPVPLIVGLVIGGVVLIVILCVLCRYLKRVVKQQREHQLREEELLYYNKQFPEESRSQARQPMSMGNTTTNIRPPSSMQEAEETNSQYRSDLKEAELGIANINKRKHIVINHKADFEEDGGVDHHIDLKQLPQSQNQNATPVVFEDD